MYDRYALGYFDECRLQCIELNDCSPSRTSETTEEYDMFRLEGDMVYPAFHETIKVGSTCKCVGSTSHESWEKLTPMPDRRYL